MAIVTGSQLERFVETYLGVFSNAISSFSPENRKVFPQYLIHPYEIVGTISTVHGVAIEFIRKARKAKIKTRQMTRRIEDVVLPRTSGTLPMFRVGRNVIISGLTLDVGKVGRFVDVPEEADVRFVEVRFLSIFQKKPQSKISDCLWIWGSNSSEDWTVEIAKRRAIADFNWLIGYDLLEHKPRTMEENLLLGEKIFDSIETPLSEFKRLVDGEPEEEEIKQFLKTNWKLLALSFHSRNLNPEFQLGETYTVDFIANSYDGQYLLIELESSKDRLYTKKGMTVELRNGFQQVLDYQKWVGEHVSYIREKLPSIAPMPKCVLIIGRKKGLNTVEQRMLSSFNEGLTRVEILTYDDIIERVELVLKNLKP